MEGRQECAHECLDSYDLASFLSCLSSDLDVQRVKTHLANCEHCRSAVCELRSILDEPGRAVPDQVVNRAKKLRANLPGNYRPTHLARHASVAAMFLLGGGLGFYFGTQSAIHARPAPLVSADFSVLGVADGATAAGNSAKTRQFHGGLR